MIVASVELRVQEEDGTNWSIADDFGVQYAVCMNVRGLLKVSIFSWCSFSGGWSVVTSKAATWTFRCNPEMEMSSKFDRARTSLLRDVMHVCHSSLLIRVRVLSPLIDFLFAHPRALL